MLPVLIAALLAASGAPAQLTDAAALAEALRRGETNAAFSLVARVTAAFDNYKSFAVEDASGRVVLAKELSAHVPEGATIRVAGQLAPPLYAHARAVCNDIAVLAQGTPPSPHPATLREFNAGLHDARLVRVRGHIVDAFRDERDPVWVYLVLLADGDTAYAAFKSPLTDGADVRGWVGCEVSAVCLAHPDEGGARHHVGRMLIARDAAALTVLRRPSWWTPARFATAAALLTAALLAALVWCRALRRMVERRSRELLRAQTARISAELRVAERTRLASDLHDSVAQNLTGASLRLNAAIRLADADPAAMREHLDLASRTIRSCRDDLRNCLWDLRSQALDAPTMDEAIRLTLKPHLGLTRLAVRFAAPRQKLLDQTAHDVLQIIRELVTNAIRHGHARNVRVAGSLDGHVLRFSVRDDGCGFDPAAAHGPDDGHFGLQGIRERVRRHGGTFALDSSPASGTRATVTLT